ncbi:MAG: YecA family protein [Rhodanobacteraceae bacterium]
MSDQDISIEPPDERELGELDLFLRSEADSGSLLLDGVHGLLTALAIGPEPAMPDEWLPEVLREPFQNESKGGQILGLLARLNDSIPDDLASEDYAPILGEIGEIDRDPRLSAAGWCEGFSRGIDLRAPLWESRMAEDPELMEMLGPIMALGLEEGVFQSEGEFERLSPNDYHTCLDQIPMAVSALRHYWRVHPLSPLERSTVSGPVALATRARGQHTLH